MAARKTKNAKKKAEEAVEVQNNPILIPQAQSEQDEQTSIQQEIQEEPVEQEEVKKEKKQEKKTTERPWFWR